MRRENKFIDSVESVQQEIRETAGKLFKRHYIRSVMRKKMKMRFKKVLSCLTRKLDKKPNSTVAVCSEIPVN